MWILRVLRAVVDGLNYASPALGAVATVGIAWLAYWQWDALHNTDAAIRSQVGIMNAQLTEMRSTSEQTNKLIAANERLSGASISQAAAANKSAQLAEDALKLTKTQLRAYVALIPPIVFNVNNRSSPVIIYPQFANNGQTPARNVERFIEISTKSPAGDFGSAIPERGILDINAGAMTPAIERSLEKPLTLEETNAIREGKNKLYVFGLIKFEDAFGDRHENQFCFEYFGSGQDFPGNGGFGYPAFLAKVCAKQ